MANVVNMAALALAGESEGTRHLQAGEHGGPAGTLPGFFRSRPRLVAGPQLGRRGMTGLQEMLLAPEPGPHGKLNLFAGWPPEWDVDFKLHAPGPTVVEGVLRGGQLVSLKVTPESRAGDVVNWLDANK